MQAKVFEQQIHLSNRLSKPLIVHTREAEQDTLRLMLEHLHPSGFVHVHCFTSSVELAQQLLQSFPNLYIGFTGVITFKNASAVRDVVGALLPPSPSLRLSPVAPIQRHASPHRIRQQRL
jgi:TatD DNase family protein